MTAPVQQNQQQDQSDAARDAVIAAIVAWLLLRTGAVSLPHKLVARLVGLGLSEKAADAAGKIALGQSSSGLGPATGAGSSSPGPAGPSSGPSSAPSAPRSAAGSTGTAGPTASSSAGSLEERPATSTVRQVKADEPEKRAEYIVKAAERLDKAEKLGTYDAAVRMEAIYAAQQQAAAQNRINAATALDKAATKAGPNGVLEWRTKRDSRVETECAALDGRRFTRDNLPEVDGRPVLPGAVHPRCRCVGVPVAASGPLSAVTA